MDWTELISRLQGQESIFWVAAASIASGATLLLVSGLVLAKRGLVKAFLGSLQKSGPSPDKENRVKLTDNGYEASVLTRASAPPGPAASSAQDYQDLNARLKKAANTLEELHLNLKGNYQMMGYSGLKAPLQDVEYVFKTGIG